MTESPDELMRRLIAADPIESDRLGSTQDRTPRELLETIMSSDTNQPLDAERPEAPMLDLPDVRGIDRYAKPQRNRYRFLAAVAAAIVAIAGFTIFSPDNTEPALAAVHRAAQTTAEIDSGRVTTNFALSGTDGGETSSLSGEIRAVFAGTNVGVEVDVAQVEGELAGAVPPVTEGRLVDGTVYSYDGTNWYAIETGGFLGESLTDIIDPRTALAEVQQLLDTEEVGQADVDGVATTHYRSVVDLDDESLQESGWLPIDTTGLEVEGELTVDLFVDDDGILRRLDLAADVIEPDGGSGAATVNVTTVFTDLGADLSVEAPADSVLIDPSDGFDLEDLSPEGLDSDD